MSQNLAAFTDHLGKGGHSATTGSIRIKSDKQANFLLCQLKAAKKALPHTTTGKQSGVEIVNFTTEHIQIKFDYYSNYVWVSNTAIYYVQTVNGMYSYYCQGTSKRPYRDIVDMINNTTTDKIANIIFDNDEPQPFYSKAEAATVADFLNGKVIQLD